MIYPTDSIYTECDSKDCQKEARPFHLSSEGISWGRKYFVYECKICHNKIRLQEKELEKIIDINSIPQAEVTYEVLDLIRRNS